MRGSSRTSLAEAVDRVEPMFLAADGARLGPDLFAVARLLDSSVQLRRALTDPAHSSYSKEELVHRLLNGKVAATTLDVVMGLARSRWSAPGDIADACEHLGVLSILAGAERAGRVDAVQQELAGFARVVQHDPRLQQGLSNLDAPADARRQLVARLVGGKVTPQSQQLIEQAVVDPRGRRTADVLNQFVAVAAARLNRLIAVVHSAADLTDLQRQRLTASLNRIYGRQVSLDVVVDPEVLGGMRIKVGDDVIDSTVLSKLSDARRSLAG